MRSCTWLIYYYCVRMSLHLVCQILDSENGSLESRQERPPCDGGATLEGCLRQNAVPSHKVSWTCRDCPSAPVCCLKCPSCLCSAHSPGLVLVLVEFSTRSSPDQKVALASP